MTILVIAEHDNKALNSVTLNTIAAAKLLGSDVHLLVAGYNIENVLKEAQKVEGVSKVLSANHTVYQSCLPENIAKLITNIAESYSHVLAPATTNGKNYLPRVAALLDVDQISDVIAIESAHIFKRPIYAGNIIETVESHAPIHVMTIRTTAFNAVSKENGTAVVEELHDVFDANISQFIEEQITPSTRPELSAAKVVVTGGRGLQNAENFKLLEALADKLNAAIGATRAAVDAGFISNEFQVGQTGKIVAPELYIAIGVSGAIQHLAGMKDSKIIVAINKDEDAPIFQVADYGLVGDLFDIVPELINQI